MTTTDPDPFEGHPEDEDGDQEQLLPLDLPDYNGRKPSGMKTAVNGAGNRISQAHDIGDRVVVLVEARVKRAGHEEVDDGIVYAETLKVVDLFELPAERGRDLLTEARQLYRHAEDEPAPDRGAAVTTDGSGTVMTPAEIAEARGESVESMTWIVTFEEGHQRTWPAEFPPGTPVPVVGATAPCTQCREGEGAARMVTLVRPPFDADAEPPAAGEPPWEGYNDATRHDIIRRLPELAAGALEHLLTYERDHKHRRSVLDPAKARLDSLTAA